MMLDNKLVWSPVHHGAPVVTWQRATIEIIIFYDLTLDAMHQLLLVEPAKGPQGHPAVALVLCGGAAEEQSQDDTQCNESEATWLLQIETVPETTAHSGHETQAIEQTEEEKEPEILKEHVVKAGDAFAPSSQ
ncbi:hypothetical protein ACLKA7_007029 [Drosophila subpalustris]